MSGKITAIILFYLGASSIRQKYLLLALSNFLIILLFYIIIINYLQCIINHKRQENIQINNLFKKKNLTKRTVISNKNTINKPDISINNILNTLEVSANKTQTIIQKIGKYNYKPDYLWDSYQIDITVAGQYRYIVNFINTIVQHYNFIVFDELNLQKITASPIEDEFILDINLTIHHNKINVTANSVLPAKNNDLISQPKTYPKNNSNLYSYSMQELQFVGSIKQYNKIIGFVTDPMGETHQITIGDKVGLKQEVITNINETGITTNAQKIN